jgi:four helix bundle protein
VQSVGRQKVDSPRFRFEDLEIWQLSIEISTKLFDIADKLERLKLFRFAEQLRGSALSVSNNIAEGSGSNSKKEFIQFLNIARRSAFENVNVLIVLNKRKLVNNEKLKGFKEDLDHLCRKITNFQRSLR